MAKRTKMVLMDDELTVCKALGEALIVENVKVVAAARAASGTMHHSSPNSLFKSQAEQDFGSDTDWDTFYTN